MNKINEEKKVFFGLTIEEHEFKKKYWGQKWYWEIYRYFLSTI